MTYRNFNPARAAAFNRVCQPFASGVCNASNKSRSNRTVTCFLVFPSGRPRRNGGLDRSISQVSGSAAIWAWISASSSAVLSRTFGFVFPVISGFLSPILNFLVGRLAQANHPEDPAKVNTNREINAAFNRAKPYFTLDSEDHLELHNVPVPKEPFHEAELAAEAIQNVDRGGVSRGYAS